ncbi:MAG TPA: winged helix-turn-helix domain-containing protein [Candidatus Sulfomarinibacteraceae bacterium]|nr:winged helix-turn-helix domain-containing protein [Candidatus Sulfomarinibacteraceae bacterium]
MTIERYRIGDLLVDTATGTVARGDRRLHLPPLSFALLVAVLRRAPDVIKRDELIDEVWNGDLVSDETLSQRVRMLRESLEDGSGSPRYLATVRGWGYRAGLPVEREGGGAASSTTVAVLPFANLGGRPEDEPLCQGLAEEIINALAHVNGLQVIARTSSTAVSRLGLDVREAGRRLSAGSIVEGSVRRSGDRVRVTVQLGETAGGGHLWSDRYDRELRDVFELEDEIAEAVARRLRSDLASGGLRRRRRPANPAAYEAYLQGRHHFNGVGGPEGMTRAAACLERSVELDPGFAPAFDALAELHWYLGFFGAVAPRDAFGQSVWYALRALELDEGLADTHALLAMLKKELDYDWAEVDREVARARELDPDSPIVRVRAAVSALLPHGRLEEALAEIDVALSRDPLSMFVRWWSGAIAYLARQPERVLDEGRRMVVLEPANPLGQWVLGMGHALAGEVEDALVRMSDAVRFSGEAPFFAGFLALAQGHGGHAVEARAILDRLLAAAEGRYVQPFAIALAHIGLGEWDEAFRWMNSAVEQRDPLVIPVKSFVFLDPVRDDPRFLSVLKAMNLS